MNDDDKHELACVNVKKTDY